MADLLNQYVCLQGRRLVCGSLPNCEVISVSRRACLSQCVLPICLSDRRVVRSRHLCLKKMIIAIEGDDLVDQQPASLQSGDLLRVDTSWHFAPRQSILCSWQNRKFITCQISPIWPVFTQKSWYGILFEKLQSRERIRYLRAFLRKGLPTFHRRHISPKSNRLANQAGETAISSRHFPPRPLSEGAP